MASGNVYVFNLYSEPAMVNLNTQGMPAMIPATSSSSSYVPSPTVVPRTNLSRDQLGGQTLFCLGDNDIVVSYGTGMWRTSVTIPAPPNPPLEQDLWLYLAYRNAFLFNSDGVLIGTSQG
jgi:hypothetical protein